MQVHGLYTVGEKDINATNLQNNFGAIKLVIC